MFTGRSSVFLLPKAVIKEINKLLKGFLWNQDEVAIGKVKVAWKYVCRSKRRGLGLKDLHMWNKAMIVKHLWHVVVDKDSLWVKWINTYKLKGRSVWDVEIETKDSWGWKCLLNLRDIVGRHMRYKIGDGKNVNIWHDKWNSEISLASRISKKEIFYAGFKDTNCVADMIDEHGWKWPPNWLSKYNWLSVITVPTLNNHPDDPI